MPVCRLIFRLDFKLNYDIVGAPEKVMRIINESAGSFWSDLGENIKGRLITARNESEENRWGRNITVSPNTISGFFEKHEGFAIEDIENDEIFLNFVKIINRLRGQFRINDLQRCGLRFFYFSKIASEENAVNQAFQRMLDNTLLEEVISSLGEIQDIGIHLEGSHEDKIKYHVNCGTYFKGEAEKKGYLEYFANKFDQVKEFDFICDIDLYEDSFFLSEMASYAKWCNPLINKARKFINLGELLLSKKIGG